MATLIEAQPGETNLAPLQQRVSQATGIPISLVQRGNVPGANAFGVERFLKALGPNKRDLLRRRGVTPDEIAMAARGETLDIRDDQGGTLSSIATASIGGLSLPIIAAIAILVGVAAWLLGGD